MNKLLKAGIVSALSPLSLLSNSRALRENEIRYKAKKKAKNRNKNKNKRRNKWLSQVF